MGRLPAFTIIAVYITCFVFSTTLAEDNGSDSPTTAPEATALFFEALAAEDIDAAIALTETIKRVPEEVVVNEYRQMAKYTKEYGRPKIVAHLRLNETAVVIFREYGPGKAATVDLDPAYLVRRDGVWRVLYELTKFNERVHALDQSTLADFKRLRKWFEGQKPGVQKLLKDPGE